MAELPRYQRLGVRAAQPGELDFANLRESAKLGRTISEQVDRMASFVYKEEQMKAEQRGAQMAQTLGATETLTRIQEAGGPTTIAERSAYNTANRIASSEIETKARLTIDNIITQAEINKTPLSEVQSRLRNVVDGYPAALSPLDAQVAGVLRAQLFGVAAQAELRYTSVASKWASEEVRASALQGLVQRQKNIYDIAASDLDPAIKQRGIESSLAATEQFLRDHQYDPSFIARTIISTREQAVKDDLISTFQRIPTLEGQKKFVADLEKSPPGTMDAEAARTLVRSFQTEINASIAVLKAEGVDIKADLRDLNTILSKGGTPNPDTLAKLEARVMRLPPEFRGDLRENFQNIKIIQAATETFRKMSPVELQNNINQMEQGIKGLGGKGLDTLAEVEVMETARALLNTMTTQLENDPISWGSQTNLIQFEPIAIGGTAQQLAGSIEKRIEQARLISARTGAPIKYLTKAEASAFSAMLRSDATVAGLDAQGQPQDATRVNKMMMLATLVSNFGTRAPDVLKQLAGVDKEMAHVGGLLLLDAPENANLAMAGFEMIKAGNEAIGSKGLEAKENFADLVGPALIFQPNARGSGFEVAHAIYTKKAIDAGEKQFNKDLWNESVQLAFGYNAATGKGGFAAVRDKTTLLPSSMDADQFETILENLTEAQVKMASGLDKVDPGLIQNVRDGDAYPVLASDGKYYLMIDSGTDGTPMPIRDKNNNLLVLDILKLTGARK